VTSNTVSAAWTAPGLLDHIAISPASASIPVGGSQVYTASSYDKFNNLIGDVTTATTFSISPEGSCVGARCTALATGPHTVTGTYNGRTAQASLTVTGGALDTAGPVVSNVATGQSPIAVNVRTTLTAAVSDATTGGSNVTSAAYNINGGSWLSMQLTAPAVTAQASATLAPFARAGIYNICVRGQDAAGNTGAPACVLLPVYDPGTFATGGGEVVSPAGANLANPSSSSTAIFAFVSAYLPRRTTPSGLVEFQLRQGGLNFRTTDMDWLVITEQRRATIRGTGTLNGTTVCQYELDAWDGSLGGSDAFGLRIFACGGTGGDRYLLQGTRLTRGAIFIHK
jgi:hypothetical protein